MRPNRKLQRTPINFRELRRTPGNSRPGPDRSSSGLAQGLLRFAKLQQGKPKVVSEHSSDITLPCCTLSSLVSLAMQARQLNHLIILLITTGCLGFPNLALVAFGEIPDGVVQMTEDPEVISANVREFLKVHLVYPRLLINSWGVTRT